MTIPYEEHLSIHSLNNVRALNSFGVVLFELNIADKVTVRHIHLQHQATICELGDSNRVSTIKLQLFATVRVNQLFQPGRNERVGA